MGTKLSGLTALVTSLVAMRVVGRRRELMALAGLGFVEMNLGSKPASKSKDMPETTAAGHCELMWSVLSPGFIKTCYWRFLEAKNDHVVSEGGLFINCPLVDMW